MDKTRKPDILTKCRERGEGKEARIRKLKKHDQRSLLKKDRPRRKKGVRTDQETRS